MFSALLIQLLYCLVCRAYVCLSSCVNCIVSYFVLFIHGLLWLCLLSHLFVLVVSLCCLCTVCFVLCAGLVICFCMVSLFNFTVVFVRRSYCFVSSLLVLPRVLLFLLLLACFLFCSWGLHCVGHLACFYLQSFPSVFTRPCTLCLGAKTECHPGHALTCI